MEKYISSLLELNNRVIVPDLGAFIIRQQDPKELVFNDLLAFDDGMLTERLIQEEKLSKTDAQNRIKSFVEKVKKVLRKGDNYPLENLGTLTMDASSKINFLSPDTKTGEREGKPAETDEAGKETVKTKEEEPAAETETETEMPGETRAEETPEDREDGFELQDEDAEVEVDAASDTPGTGGSGADARAEEPPFQIEEREGEEKSGTEPEPETTAEQSPAEEQEQEQEQEQEPVPGQVREEEATETEEEIPARFREALAEEPAGNENMTIEELIEKEEEQYRVKVEGVPVNLESDDTSFSSYTQPSRRRRAWPWVLGAILLIVAILVAGRYLFPDRMNRILPEGLSLKPGQKEQEYSPASMQPADGEESGNVDDSQEATAPETGKQAEATGETEGSSRESAEGTETRADNPAPPVSAGGKRYYVVAGCFADIRNAENYVRTLRAQGYDASVFGKRDNLHAVCFSSYSNKKEARVEQQRIQNTYDPAAWILYY